MRRLRIGGVAKRHASVRRSALAFLHIPVSVAVCPQALQLCFQLRQCAEHASRLLAYGTSSAPEFVRPVNRWPEHNP